MVNLHQSLVQCWKASSLYKQLINLITDYYFLLFDSEPEFRALSYEIYPQAIKRFKFLEGQSEMIFRFIKSAHSIRNNFIEYDKDFFISDSIYEWIFDTYRKYGVNIYNFCIEWVEYFSDHPEIWPKGHKKKSKYYDKKEEYKGLNLSESLFWDYDFRQKNNLFGLDALYRNMPKKSFARGKKQEFEAVLMYCWLHRIDSDDVYWDEHSANVL